jgi:hypothetical protein
MKKISEFDLHFEAIKTLLDKTKELVDLLMKCDIADKDAVIYIKDVAVNSLLIRINQLFQFDSEWSNVGNILEWEVQENLGIVFDYLTDTKRKNLPYSLIAYNYNKALEGASKAYNKMIDFDMSFEIPDEKGTADVE